MNITFLRLSFALTAKCSQMATIIRNHPTSNNATRAMQKSNSRLKKCLYIILLS